MTFIYLWVYTLLLVILWWFFIIAKLHAYKFKNFSNKIESITKILLFSMFFLSLLWYFVIIYSWIKSENNSYEKIDFIFNSNTY